MLTPVARAAVDFVPIHINRAPVAGSGKSYLFSVATAIASGTRCPVIAAGAKEEETEKRLVSKILVGVQIICLDNVNGVLSGDLLCQIVTQDTVSPRILGLSKTPVITNVFVIFANGNNIRVAGDLTRRTLWCVMDAWQDATAVQSRDFEGRDPVAKVLADRGKYIAACLTILRAHHLAGYEGAKGLTPFTGFDEWSRVVRGALVWLGKADPVKSLEVGRADDPQRDEREAFVEALYDMGAHSENTALTVAQMAENMIRTTHNAGTYKDPIWIERGSPEMREALQEFIDHKGDVNIRKVSQWFLKFMDETFGLKRLKNASAGKGKKKWYVSVLPVPVAE